MIPSQLSPIFCSLCCHCSSCPDHCLLHRSPASVAGRLASVAPPLLQPSKQPGTCHFHSPACWQCCCSCSVKVAVTPSPLCVSAASFPALTSGRKKPFQKSLLLCLILEHRGEVAQDGVSQLARQVRPTACVRGQRGSDCAHHSQLFVRTKVCICIFASAPVAAVSLCVLPFCRSEDSRKVTQAPFTGSCDGKVWCQLFETVMAGDALSDMRQASVI